VILKASQRGGGQDLASHLMRTDENEHVSVHELSGFASDNLNEAFKEVDAVSRGTRCRQYLFSLSLSPPEHERVPVTVFEQAINRIEERLGLAGQPRAIVFHEKDGRRHAHCVWSRIDAETMTARQLSFFKTKLMGLSRELYLEHGWDMPRGIANAAERNPLNFTLAEWQQAKRQGIDPRWMKQAVQTCWKTSDDRRAFERSLEERGYFLARGDKRGFVVLDHTGEVLSLPRVLELKTRDVRARLGAGNNLRSVEAARQVVGQRMTPAIRRHIDETRAQFQKHFAALDRSRKEMTENHRAARSSVENRQKSEWEAETRARAARLPKGWHGLWHRLTGKYQEVRRQSEAEAVSTCARHAQERQALIDKQIEVRAGLQAQTRDLRHRQAEQLHELRRDRAHYRALTRGNIGRAQSRGARNGIGVER